MTDPPGHCAGTAAHGRRSGQSAHPLGGNDAADWLEVSPLHEFARKDDREKAAIFLDHGADLHARDEDICSTPLGWAAKFGKKEMVEFLLQRGAKPNLSGDPPWATPLAWATRREHTEIVELLRRHGAK
ncbi:MAG: ankyrin repeat domain-containing protein [Verrucomicrobia bacterium]|nr:ankyrin repeat domain-containing protein [Verrucomicrobiota bacterium]